MNQPRDEKGRFMSPSGLEIGLDWSKDYFVEPPQISTVILIGIKIANLGVIYGGPYRDKPPFLKGLKLAPEVAGEADYEMPIQDFGTPKFQDMENAVLFGLQTLYKTGALYVGCLMGQGRTGTYIACLLKAIGYKKPILKVRNLYNSKAVETKAQEEFVDNFTAEKFHYLIKIMGIRIDS